MPILELRRLPDSGAAPLVTLDRDRARRFILAGRGTLGAFDRRKAAARGLLQANLP